MFFLTYSYQKKQRPKSTIDAIVSKCFAMCLTLVHCLFNGYSMCIQCLLNVQQMCIQGALNVQMFIQLLTDDLLLIYPPFFERFPNL